MINDVCNLYMERNHIVGRALRTPCKKKKPHFKCFKTVHANRVYRVYRDL